jgi:hypothetical protein
MHRYTQVPYVIRVPAQSAFMIHSEEGKCHVTPIVSTLRVLGQVFIVPIAESCIVTRLFRLLMLAQLKLGHRRACVSIYRLKAKKCHVCHKRSQPTRNTRMPAQTAQMYFGDFSNYQKLL